MEKRLYWIDNFKGLGMIAIVLGHSNFPKENLFVQYLFSFHVLIFLLISGFLFNDDKYVSFKKFAIEKFHRLIIPYFLFNLINYIIIALRYRQFGIMPSQFMANTLRAIYIGEGQQNLYNVPTWFLPCLFFISIYYFLINKYVKDKRIKILILLFISIIVYLESKVTYFRFPLSLEIALMGTLFYGIGHIFNKEITLFTEKISIIYLCLLPFIILLNLKFLNNTNMSANSYGNYIKFLLCSFLGGVTLLIISKLLNKNPILSFLGKNSIIIMGMEWTKTVILNFLSAISLGLVKVEPSISSGIIQGISYLIVLIPIIFAINKFFPFFIGRPVKKQFVEELL